MTIIAGFTQSARAGFFEHLLPAWPLNNVGDPIPRELIQVWRGKANLCPGLKGEFSAFPSKGNKDPNSPADPKQPNGPKIKDTLNYKLDHSSICDDGDQTTYNGLLCASGETAGCESIAQAQDENGRLYRSPHRRWMWKDRCFDKRNPLDGDPKNPTVFNDQCANGFSPDMNLGVLLYTLKTNDLRRYNSWLRWLDSNAATTVLCKLDDKNHVIDGTCDRVEWPRVCPEDLGHLNPGESPGYAINGKYGGLCALRPWDTLDFAAVDGAVSIAPPRRMSNWDVNARAMILASKVILNGIPGVGPAVGPISEVPPLILMSSVDGAYFPLHLDAIRVLIRMMIRNPSLELNNLPDMPDPGDLPGILGIAASNATDPASIKTAAEIISSRATWNPFYKLLSDGPTPEVRSMILDRCPTSNDIIDKGDWIWEKGTKLRSDGTLDNDKHHSMGWDCVFVGNLYNKMRVKKNLVDELFSLFLKYADVVGNSLKQLSQTLQIAQAANALAQKTLNEAQNALTSAQDFVNKEYEQQKKAALARVTELTAQLNQLTQQEANLEKQAADLRNNALNLPDKVFTQVTDQVCKSLPWPAGDLCKKVTKTVESVNQQKQNILGQVTSIEKQIVNLKTQTIIDTHAKLADATALVAKLDDRLQTAHNNLQKNILQTAVKIAEADFALKAHLLTEAQKHVAEAQRADARVNGYLCVWKKDAKCSS
jgi:hypothetical protein